MFRDKNYRNVIGWLLSPKVNAQAKRKIVKVMADVLNNSEIYYKKGGEVGVRFKKKF